METQHQGDVTALEALRALYDELPSIDCKGLCWNSCGAIDASPVERAHIADLGVEIPVFTEEAAQRWARNEPDYCPAFSLGAQGLGKPGCTVYEQRPMICRLWGLNEDMRCPYGCEPERELTIRETYDYLFRAMRAGGHPLIDERLERDVYAVLDDPEGAEFMHRYVQGDMSARDEAHAAFDTINRRL